MRIEVIPSLEGLSTLQPDWLKLWRACPRATPFQSPQWLLPWTRHLFGGGEIWALAMWDGPDLAGFAPLFCWGTERRTVSFLGAGISDYGDILFAPGREADCAEVVRTFLETQACWDQIDLQEVRRGSALLDGWESETCSVCPVLTLSSFPDSMDRKHRTDLRRAQNRLARSEARFSAATLPTLDQHLDAFLQMYEARWGGTDAAVKAFHREAAKNFAETGNLNLSLLTIDGAPAASIYAFTSGATLFCYLTGFDAGFAKLSPGAVLLAWVIDQAVANKMEEVDFLRDTESYKYLWGARDRESFKMRSRRGRA